MQANVRHADLAERKDLVEPVAGRIEQINMGVTCVGKSATVGGQGRFREEAGP